MPENLKRKTIHLALLGGSLWVLGTALMVFTEALALRIVGAVLFASGIACVVWASIRGVGGER
jgi:hypothetical protein